MWHSLLALVLCPLLCLPTIVRKARLSFEYTGLVFFHAEIFGLGYYLLPNVSTSTLVAWTSAFSGLGVRLFFQTNQYWSEYCNKRVAMFLSYFFWPFTAALNILYIALLSLAQLLNYWWVILMGTIAGMYFSHAAMGAALAAGIVLLPQLLGVTVYSLLPTGFGNAGYGNTLGGYLTEDNLHIRGFDNTFDTGFSAGSVMFDINPANGQPMMGGFGGADIYGNTYGTNFNDP